MAYCIGLAAAALVANPASRPFPRIAALAAGGFLGFLLGYGAWGWRLWEWHGNPFFPYFNQIFQSPDAAAIAWTDERFRPDGLIEGLSLPLRLLMLNRDFSELPVRTPLLLLGLLSICGLSWRRRGNGLPQRHAVHAVSAFFVASLVVWTVQSGILRYTSPLEVVAAALLVAALASFARTRNPMVAAALALAIVAFTVQPNWGRQPFKRHFLVADWPALPKDSMLVISGGAPLAFFALGLPGEVPIVAISNNLLHPERCQGLQQRAGLLIRDHRGPMWMLEENSDSRDQLRGRGIARRHYGLVAADSCTIMRSTFGQIRMCQATREPAAITCTPDGPTASYMRPASK
jgi:hypothetical protein